MTIELDDYDTSYEIADYLNWVLETGIWNGREVAWVEAAEFRDEVQTRIFELLFDNSEDSVFEHLAAQLAWIGTPASDRSLLARDIQELDFSKGDLLLQVGFRKSLSKFWKKHKKEILIGAAIVAVVTVVVVVAVSTAGTGVAAVAAAGGAALGARSEKDDKHHSPSPQIAQPEVVPMTAPAIPNNKLVFGETGVVLDGQYSNYNDILLNQTTLTPPPDLKTQSWIGNFFETIGKGIIEPDLLDPSKPLPTNEPSSRFSTTGKREPHLCIGGINGMNTSMQEALSHANYIAQFAPDRSIDWVYNRSHGGAIDLAEIFTMNYLGISPNTSRLLRGSWEAFHQENADNPHAKYLQFCHSQGAIHVRNALAKSPKEICDRVIVVAIAPAAIIPEEMCFESFNYASKNDPIPYGELVSASALNADELGASKRLEMIMDLRKQLILLEPAPNATGIDHDYQSPTFTDTIKSHIFNYVKNKGSFQ